MRYANMESGGPWYSASVRAASVLGHRAMRAGTISYRDLQAQLETQLASELKGRKAPSLEIIRQWERNQPDLPERAVRDGLVSPALLPGWAQNQLRLNLSNVEVHQEQSNGWGWGELIVAGLALFAIYKALNEPVPPVSRQSQLGTNPLGDSQVLRFYRGR